VHIACCDGLRGRLNDWRWRRKIGFPDFHVHDIPALLLKFPGLGQQFHDAKRLDTIDTVWMI
jgi:hypothetical protein